MCFQRALTPWKHTFTLLPVLPHSFTQLILSAFYLLSSHFFFFKTCTHGSQVYSCLNRASSFPNASHSFAAKASASKSSSLLREWGVICSGFYKKNRFADTLPLKYWNPDEPTLILQIAILCRAIFWSEMQERVVPFGGFCQIPRLTIQAFTASTLLCLIRAVRRRKVPVTSVRSPLVL